MSLIQDRSPNYGCSKKAKIATIAKEIQIIRRMNLLKRRSHCADVSPHLDLFLTFSGIKHFQVFFQSVSWGSAFTFSAPPRTSVQALGIPKIRQGITHFWNKVHEIRGKPWGIVCWFCQKSPVPALEFGIVSPWYCQGAADSRADFTWADPFSLIHLFIYSFIHLWNM